jgi:hypothetical protein
MYPRENQKGRKPDHSFPLRPYRWTSINKTSYLELSRLFPTTKTKTHRTRTVTLHFNTPTYPNDLPLGFGIMTLQRTYNRQTDTTHYAVKASLVS